jgi:hypothetical protein
MKNTLYLSLFILVLGSTSLLGLPWWCITLIAMIGAFLFQLGAAATFGVATAAGTLLWTTVALFWTLPNGGLLATKVGQIFQGLSGAQLVMLTGLIGGLLSGLGAMTGYSLRALFVDKKPKRYAVKKYY